MADLLNFRFKLFIGQGRHPFVESHFFHVPCCFFACLNRFFIERADRCKRLRHHEHNEVFTFINAANQLNIKPTV